MTSKALMTVAFAATTVACIPGGYTQVQYKMLQNQVPANVGKLVDVKRAAVGEYVERTTQKGDKESVTIVAVVAETPEGHKVVEHLQPNWISLNEDKTMATAFVVDADGNVHEAWGGLLGMPMVMLTVVKPVALPEEDPGESTALEPRQIVGFEATGEKWGDGSYATSLWKHSDFPFFEGVLRLEAGARKSEVTTYAKEGAVARVPRPVPEG